MNLKDFPHCDETDNGCHALVNDWNSGVHWDESEYIDDTDDDFVMSEIDYEETDHLINTARDGNTCTLSSYFTEALNSKKKVPTSKRRLKRPRKQTPNLATSSDGTYFGKESVIFLREEDECEEETTTNVSESQTPIPVLPEPFSVSVSSEQVAPKTILASFGDSYKEAACLPRLFSVELNNMVGNQDGSVNQAVLCQLQHPPQPVDMVNVG